MNKDKRQTADKYFWITPAGSTEHSAGSEYIVLDIGLDMAARSVMLEYAEQIVDEQPERASRIRSQIERLYRS